MGFRALAKPLEGNPYPHSISWAIDLASLWRGINRWYRYSYGKILVGTRLDLVGCWGGDCENLAKFFGNCAISSVGY
jgi:hypothetical protein